MQRYVLIVTGWCLGAGLVATASSAQGDSPRLDCVAQLGTDTVIEGELAVGEERLYCLELPADQLLRVVAEQRGVDLELSLISSDGAVVATADGPGGRWIPETLVTLTGAAGQYGLRLTAHEMAPGDFTLRVDELRDRRHDDPARVAAEQAYERAVHLVATGSQVNVKAALTNLTTSLATWLEIGDRRWQARALLEIGACHLEIGDARAAIDAWQQALELQMDLGDLDSQATSLDLLGRAHQQLGEMTVAREHYSRSLELARTAGSPQTLAWALMDNGHWSSATGDLGDALKLYGEALDVARAHRLVATQLGALINLGGALRRTGDPDRALESYREALSLTGRLDDTTMQVRLLSNMGVALRSVGETREALESYQTAYRLSQKLGMRQEEAVVASNLGQVYGILGETERAMELTRHALQLHTELESPRWQAWALRQIGWIYEGWHDFAQALASYERGLTLCRQVADRATESYILQGMGRVSSSLGRHEHAIALLEQALDIQVSTKDLANQISSLVALAEAQMRRGDIDKAQEAAERALALSLDLGDPFREMNARSVITSLERARGKLESSLEMSLDLLGRIESQRLELVHPDYRAAYLSKRQDEYVRAVDLLVELHTREPLRGYAVKAFETAERARARTLLDRLAEEWSSARVAVSAEIEGTRQRLIGRLSWLQRQLAQALAVGNGSSRQEVTDLRRELDAVRKGLEDVEWQARSSTTDDSSALKTDLATLAQLQATLDGKTAILEYVLGEERSFVFAVTRDELRVATLAPSHGILELAASLRTDLEQPRARRSRLDRTSRQLCDMLIGPILGPITPTDRLIIVPDRGLHYIPFEALELAPEPVAAGSNPHYLVASWKIGYAPSASVFLSLADRSARHGRTRERALVAFADPAPFRLGDGDEDMEVADNRVRGWAGDDAIDLRPLPGARAEAAQIAALFDPEAVTTMVGADATEKAFKELPAVRSARWIHFACHGLLDEHQPAYSALVLSPAMDDDEDGLLQSHEIAKLKLAADLVVLSACTTGLGKEVRGEGLVGLTQAFIEAGARSVIVSLWPVSDRSTARLMVRLYRGLEDGLDPPTALREAKLSLLHDASTAHPYFWSGFVVVGSTEVSEIGNESATLPPAVSRGAENEPSPGRRGPTVDEPQEE